MKKFLKLALAAAIGFSTFTATAKAGNTMRDHNVLWHAIENSGTPIFVNVPSECKDNWGGGVYITAPTGKTALVVCQDHGAEAGEGNQVTWTANDLDTLRHEAHHIVQDCAYGTKGDRWLDTFFTGDALTSFVVKNLSEEKINFIVRSYPSNKHLTELEAFAVADSVDASAIADAITDICK